ncbi:MAG: cell division topological specificity factor MinE [Rhodobacteraceae bacterium]|uniref:cell division topological specificity factor MinE n=1 Tax=Amaricoccus sp. B4 TaxID=3368557 RepID=UPI000DAD8637|nr:cell division topological specificity factor MinE [Paracoccaceae bacterium]
MFGFSFKPRKASNTAQTAKERLQILLAHERVDRSNSELLPILQKEILEVIKRHMQVDSDTVDIKLERGDDMSSLEINIELPGAQMLATRGAA